MRISIRHNSSYLIEFDQIQINGRKAVGGYAFTFILKGNRSPCESPLEIFNINLSLSTSMPDASIILSVPSSTQLIQCSKYPQTEHIHFEAVLTKEQINTIEEYRQEGDLNLKVGLRAMTLSGGQLWSSFDYGDVIVSREHWLKALRDAKFRQTILFEVPLPNVSEEFTTLISKAQEFIETGHYKDAVMQCRHVIEQIEKIRDDKALSIEANKKSHNRQEREGMTAIERMLSMREQFKNICHLGAHGNEFFTRSQAKTILSITTALLAEPTVGFFGFTEKEKE